MTCSPPARTIKKAETLPQLDAGYYRLAQIDYLRNNQAGSREHPSSYPTKSLEAEYFVGPLPERWTRQGQLTP
jgi:hypothetical protein